MDGMQYIKPSFSAPAGPVKITQVQWDYAFLTEEAFAKKYNYPKKIYEVSQKMKSDLQ
jgi:hypothetical protein